MILYRFFFNTTGTLHDPYSTNDDYLESPRDQSLYDIGPHTTSSTSYSSNSSTPVTTTLQRVFTNAFAPTSSDDIQLGMEVLVARSRGQIGRGKVKYVGPLPGRRDTYIGIELGPGQGKKTKFTTGKKTVFPEGWRPIYWCCDKFEAKQKSIVDSKASFSAIFLRMPSTRNVSFWTWIDYSG